MYFTLVVFIMSCLAASEDVGTRAGKMEGKIGERRVWVNVRIFPYHDGKLEHQFLSRG